MIASVSDNENKRWKRKGKKQRQKINKGVMQAIVNVWELKEFAVCLG